MSDTEVKIRQIIALSGPEKGNIIDVVYEGGQSPVAWFCKVCNMMTHRSYDYERTSGRAFCTKHWAPYLVRGANYRHEVRNANCRPN